MNKLSFIYNKLHQLYDVSKLNINNSGIDSEGDPFVELENGTRFFGVKSYAKDRKYYNLFPKKVKSKLPFECFRTALDIAIRYKGGGLKYLGPKKEKKYNVQKGDNVAEMGACMGYYTMYLAQKVGKEGRVIAIEPIKENLRLLKKNMEYNGFSQCSIIKKGVSNETGEVVFNRDPKDYQSNSIVIERDVYETETCKTDTLDNIFKSENISDLDLMIVQLNGVEYQALQGLTSFKPRYISVAARYNRQASKVEGILKSRGYNIETYESEFVFAF